MGSGMLSSNVASSPALLWNMLVLQDVGAGVVMALLDSCEVWKDAIASSFRLWLHSLVRSSFGVVSGVPGVHCFDAT